MHTQNRLIYNIKRAYNKEKYRHEIIDKIYSLSQ